jgi:hypothetical protein
MYQLAKLHNMTIINQVVKLPICNPLIIKFIADGISWRINPKNKCFVYDVYGSKMNLMQPNDDTQNGSLSDITMS